MDVLALQNELETLNPDDQNRIAAFLTLLRLKRQGDFQQIEESLSDSDENKWVNWKDAKSELGLED